MPRGPATFRGPTGPTVNMRYERALYERARDRSAQGPGFSLGGPGKVSQLMSERINRIYSVGRSAKHSAS